MTVLRRVPLSARLLVITLVLLAVGLVATTAVVVASLRGPLVDRVDSQLRAGGELLSRVPPQALAAFGDATPGDASEVLELVTAMHVTYLSADGLAAGTFRLGGDVASDLPAFDAATAARTGRPFDVSPSWRVLVLPARYQGAGQGDVVVFASSLDEVEAIVGGVRTNCYLIGSALLVLLSLLGFFALRAGLRPLRQIEATSTAIAAGEPGRRVPDIAAPTTEVGSLAAAMNGMLDRIDEAAAARAASEARTRRFVADASHELRTPLAGISGSTELYRMGALPERADVDRTMDRIERESRRLERLVDDLLLLARFDEADPTALRMEPMDLRAVAVDALHDLRALDPTRPVSLTGPGGGPVGPAPVLGDEARLRQVVTNLVGNAVRHTPAATAVRVGVGTVDGRAVVEVADDGPGLTAEQAERVFERFYRADASRTRADGGGAGLGLAIARSLVAAQGGDLLVTTTPGAGAVFTMALPARPA
ncbi:HAMP domain-containing sensor histidine kinase [Umezawaea sp. Da 62-37]|uniref:HAMP domain-containing sensor histidine kinase n=1 Tax=Umezawaea sp. Da 62-37 TaxID=3075927 RepID=UPI0028F70CF8|nr:HAMP domain-containing sensor histidine kinase [Umezawaea sp. Da 62-37]WNV89421.1 HAMP domain-containing sensor histidine kinase [Umezawaea sp. Da 62-37]